MNDYGKHAHFDQMYLQLTKRDLHIIHEANELAAAVGTTDPILAWSMAVKMLGHWDTFSKNLDEIAKRNGMYRKQSGRLVAAQQSSLGQLFVKLGLIKLVEDQNGP